MHRARCEFGAKRGVRDGHQSQAAGVCWMRARQLPRWPPMKASCWIILKSLGAAKRSRSRRCPSLPSPRRRRGRVRSHAQRGAGRACPARKSKPAQSADAAARGACGSRINLGFATGLDCQHGFGRAHPTNRALRLLARESDDRCAVRRGHPARGAVVAQGFHGRS